MAVVLVCLIVGLTGGRPLFFKIALGALLVDMTWPKLYLPIAFVWLGMAKGISGIVSRVMLMLIFMLVVTPLGFLKRHVGSEPLRLKEWKRSRDSVFVVRDRRYLARDCEKPY